MTAPSPTRSTQPAQPWFAVVASRDLQPGKVMPVVLDGQHVVVWRGKDGAAHAWVDSCPHRGTRLSLGAVAEDSLLCPYHGWRFGPDGQCQHIPAHPSTAPSAAAKTRSYPLLEQDGYAWVCTGAPSSSMPQALPAAEPIRSMHVELATDLALAAALLCPLDPEGKSDLTLSDALLAEATWTAGDGVTLEARLADGSTFRAHAGAYRVACTLTRGEARVSYQILLQPAQSGHCALQLSLLDGGDAGTKTALSRSLSFVARQLPARLPALQRMRAQLQACASNTTALSAQGSPA